MDVGRSRGWKLTRRDFLKAAGIATVGVSVTPDALLAAPSRPSTRALRIGQYAEPINLNPIMEMVDRPALQIESNIYTPLVYLDYRTAQLRPGLATSWTRKNVKKWVFELRKGVKFHKGYGELTAEDVAFYCNYMIENNKPTVWLFTALQGAKVLDKYTVEYNTKESFAPLPYFIGYGLGGWIVSKKAYEEMGEESFNRNPIGTGPYEFRTWRRGSHIVIRRFPEFWGEKGQLEEITFRPIPDPFVRSSLLRAGEIDLIDAPDYKDVAGFRKDPRFTVQSVAGWNFDYLQPNHKREPFNNVKVRQAISYALDRQEIASNVYYGESTPDDDALPPGFAFDAPDIQVYPNRAHGTKAKQLLAEAGFPNGFQTTIITSERPSARRAVQLIASQLSKVGIQAQPQVLESGTYKARWRKGDFDLATEFIVIATPDPDSAFYHFYHTGSNNHGYESKDMDAMLDDARAESSGARRKDLYRKIIQKAMNDVPYIYLGHSNVVRISKKGLANVPITPQEIYLPLDQVRWS